MPHNPSWRHGQHKTALSQVLPDLKTNSSSCRVQSLTEDPFLSPRRAFPGALCLSPAQWMLPLYPPSWQMPALQNKDDISAVVLGLRKGIIPGSSGQDAAHKGGCATPLFVLRQGGPWRPWPRANTRPVCGETCAHSRGSTPAKSPASWHTCVSFLPSPPHYARAHKEPAAPGPGARRAGPARATGNQDQPPLLLPFQNRGVVLSLRRIMSLSPGTHWTAHPPKMQSG